MSAAAWESKERKRKLENNKIQKLKGRGMHKVRVQKQPEGQLVEGQKEKETPMGAEVLSEEEEKDGQRCRQKHNKTETCRRKETRERETDRETDVVGQKKQAEASVESTCQQSCNYCLMVDSPGGKMMARGRKRRAGM